MTEFNDAVSAVYAALPGKFKPHRSLTMQQKLAILYRHSDAVSMPKAISNLIQNEIEDRALGAMGNLAKKAVRSNPYWGSPVGLQAGVATALRSRINTLGSYGEVLCLFIGVVVELHGPAIGGVHRMHDPDFVVLPPCVS